MKKSIKLTAVVVGFLMALSTILIITNMDKREVIKAGASQADADKYAVTIVTKEGNPELLSNRTALPKGENLYLTYTIDSVESYSQDGTKSRFFSILGTSSISMKNYPSATYPDVTDGNEVCNVLGLTQGQAYEQYKKIEDTGFFNPGQTYTLKITTTNGGKSYVADLTSGGKSLYKSNIAYKAFYGISFYCYAFTAKFSNVHSSTDTKDMGILAWNNGQPKDYSTTENISKKDLGVDIKRDCLITDTTFVSVSIKDKIGYSGKNCAEIKTRQKKADLYLTLPEMDKLNVGDMIHISFRLKPQGGIGVYYDFHLKTWGDKLIDYAYQKDIWNFVNFDANVFLKDGKKVVLLHFDELNGETIYISNIKASDDVFLGENLFKGLELYQLMGKHVLHMGYLAVTPSQKVIVVDGGDKADADQLYKLIRQYSGKVDGWYISHFHSDHTGALLEMLKKDDIVIENLYADRRTINLDTFEDSDIVEQIVGIEEQMKKYPGKVKNYEMTKRGDIHEYGDGIRIKILNDAFFEANTNYGNESTVTYKMETPGEDILFLGDLGIHGDKYLQDPVYLEEVRSCRVVQMAHHGQNGVSDLYYECIDDIKVCLYPALRWIYDASSGGGLGSANLNTLKTRNLMRERGVRLIYTNAEGRVKLT